MAVTECTVIDTLQVLDPEGTTVDTTGDRPLEDGIAPLVVAQSYVDVTFLTPHASYNFDQFVIENFTDNPPLAICIGPVVFEDENGFRVMLSAAPDSAFYQLRWRITV